MQNRRLAMVGSISFFVLLYITILVAAAKISEASDENNYEYDDVAKPSTGTVENVKKPVISAKTTPKGAPPPPPPCHCRENITLSTNNASSCSDDAYYTHSSQGKNVVAYTYQGRPHKAGSYIPAELKSGVLENLKRMRELYPGYEMRLYTDIPLEFEACGMVCQNPELRWCDIRNTPSHGDLSSMFYKTWRMLPLGDPTVDILLVGDLNSFPTERERAAVRFWLDNINRAIIIMQDHFKDGVPIQGGTWAARNSKLLEDIGGPSNVETLRSAIFLKSKQRFRDSDPDQKILLDPSLFSTGIRKIIWLDEVPTLETDKGKHEIGLSPVL